MSKMPYVAPFVHIKRQRLTLSQFKEDFEAFLEEDPEFKDAIIVGARMVDDPTTIKDGAIVFDCYLQSSNCEGTFTVPVLQSDILN